MITPIPNSQWIRTCQECGAKRQCDPPQPTWPKDRLDRYMEAKCKRCGSRAFDYGSYKSTNADIKE